MFESDLLIAYKQNFFKQAIKIISSFTKVFNDQGIWILRGYDIYNLQYLRALIKVEIHDVEPQQHVDKNIYNVNKNI